MRQRRTIRAITAAVAAASAGLVSAVMALPATAASVELVNIGFEGGTIAPMSVDSGATATVVDTEAHSGTHSVLVDGRANPWDTIRLDLLAQGFEPGTYEISAWIKLAPTATGTTGANVTVLQEPYADSAEQYKTVGQWGKTVGTDEWVQIGGEYQLGADKTTAVLYIDVQAQGEVQPDFLLDDLVITGAPPATPGSVVVQHLTFDDESFAPWTESGGPALAYVDDGQGGKALSITRKADYDGIQSAEGILEPGVTYTLSMRAKLPEGTPGSVNARLVVKPSYTWIPDGGVDVTAGDWTTITGTYTLPEDVDPLESQIYIGLGPANTEQMTVIVDDVLITRPATGVSLSWDFEDGIGEWVPRDGGGGAPTVEVTTAEAHGGAQAALVSDRVEQGSGMGIDLSDVLEAGQTYRITAWVKTAEGQTPAEITLSMETRVGEGASNYANLQRLEQSTATWQQIDVNYTVPSTKPDLMFLYFESYYEIANTSDLLIDDVAITTFIPEWDSSLTPLKDAVDFPIGVAIDSRETSGAAAEMVVHHFDQITPENHMKVEAWYAGTGDDTFRINPEAKDLMDFASANGLRLYGHTLVWHSQTPDWFFQDESGRELTSSEADKQFLRERLHTHINKVAEALSTGGGYGLFGSPTNPVVAFDVVNEVVADVASPATQGLRNSRWYQVLGEEYIHLAFQYAYEAFNETYAVEGKDPVTLFINDYNTEDSGKAGRMHALVERLVEADVPVQGVGHQFHVNLNRNIADLEAAIDLFADMENAAGEPMWQAVTELDVAIGIPETTRNRIEQGYYYKAVFDMLRAHQDEIFSATVWGLTDVRSWRDGEGAPLLFDDNLRAKPAYYGIADPSKLEPRQQAANVFRADVAIDDDALTNPVWTDMPLLRVGTDAQFQLRWAPDAMVAYVHVADDTDDAEDKAVFTYRLSSSSDLQTVTVLRSDDDAADRRVASDEDGWTAVVRLPLPDLAAQGTTYMLDLDVTDGSDVASWNDADALGTLTFVERASVTEVVRASTAPVIDGVVDDVWEDALAETTDKFTQGSDGAQAVVRTLWADDTLYVLMRVSDPVLDDTASNPWEQDSVEIYVDRGNVKNGAYRNQGDTQYRINFKNVRSFGTGDETWQSDSLVSAAEVVPGGYIVEAAIDLNGAGGLGTVQGLDFQVNNAANGVRTSIVNWADPTGTGYQSTARWGVGKLVDEPSAVDVPGLETVDQVRAVADWDVAPNQPICVPMAGEHGIPENATGVMVNVTTVRPNDVGHVVVYPAPTTKASGGTAAAAAAAPATSTVNFEPGQDVANATFIGLGADGGLCYMTRGASRAGVLIDVQGYLTEESGIVTAMPQRILDTRAGSLHVGSITGPIRPRTVYTVPVAGRAGVPEDASAVIVNVTVTGTLQGGHLRVFPAGATVPNISTVNYAPFRDKANTTIVQLPESGEISFYSDTFGSVSENPVQVILDVVGYVDAETTYTAVEPRRVLDTRVDRTAPLNAREKLTMQIADVGPVPVGATSVVLNVTAVRPNGNGHLRVYGDPTGGTMAPPAVSSINYIPDRDIPNLVVVDVPISGTITLYTDQFAGGRVHLVVDVVGFVAPAPGLPTEQPGPWEPNLPVDFVPGGAVAPTTDQSSSARGTGNRVALTFDDGPMYTEDTTRLLDFLAEHDIQAVFCVIGDNIEAPGGAALLQRMVADGHVLCNHGTSYASMENWSEYQIAADLMENLEIIRDALGDPDAEVPYFRAPNGQWGRTPAVAVALGMQPLGLGNVIMDWEDAVQADVEQLKTNLRNAMTPGAIVLAHTGGGSSRANTVTATIAVVEEKLADGWTFTLPVGGPA